MRSPREVIRHYTMARWIPKKCKTGLVVIGFWDDILKTWNCFSVETLMRPQVCDTGTWHDYPFIKYKQWQAFPVSSLLKKSVYWRRALRVSLKPKSMLNPIVLQRYACKLEAWLTSGFCAKPTEQVNDQKVFPTGKSNLSRMKTLLII